jgi:hypothetical protein
MKKRLITWKEFNEALSAQAPWVVSAWFAFTDAGVVWLSDDTKPNEIVTAHADEDGKDLAGKNH